MIRAVFFDFYNTLSRFYPFREELQAKACEEFGIHVTSEGITRGYALADAHMAHEVAELPLWERDTQGRNDFFAEYQRLIFQGAGKEVSLELALKVISRVRQFSYGYALFDDVLPTLAVLKDMGFTLALLSNNDEDINKLCNDLGLFPHMDFAISAQEVGSVKPYPPIFIQALRRAEVEPQETLYVGDQYETDVKGARGVGIHPVLLDRDVLMTDVKDCPRIEGLVELVDLVRRMGS
ncbi:MAG: HAD family hydrolase [Dehalococcoidia bacterium]|jgi:putative hydrolase of the HAD superfamily|nr:HAD family hydrolase [Dehalococcoidia bacterium]MDP6495344.1 HAD family hydrolase [Dehalococcoidia bacterium]